MGGLTGGHRRCPASATPIGFLEPKRSFQVATTGGERVLWALFAIEAHPLGSPGSEAAFEEFSVGDWTWPERSGSGKSSSGSFRNGPSGEVQADAGAAEPTR